MSQPAHLLVVDDDETFRYTASKALEKAGFLVRTAPDYRDALTLIESDQPLDLLITDLMMPDRINGFALARMARMRRLDLKVIYVTAFDVPTIEAIGRVLRKPLAEDQLVKEVALALAS